VIHVLLDIFSTDDSFLVLCLCVLFFFFELCLCVLEEEILDEGREKVSVLVCVHIQIRIAASCAH